MSKSEEMYISDYDDLVSFAEAHRDAVELGQTTFVFKKQYVDTRLAECILDKHMARGQ